VLSAFSREVVSVADVNPRDLPNSARAAAVEHWETAVQQVSDPELQAALSELNIHDRQDRMEIEELIEHEVADDDYLPLHDAFDELQTHFEEVWGDV
jgi:hypothetical protein